MMSYGEEMMRFHGRPQIGILDPDYDYDEVPANAKFKMTLEITYTADDDIYDLEDNLLCQKGEVYVQYRDIYARNEEDAIETEACTDDGCEELPDWTEACWEDRKVEVIDVDYDDWRY